MKTWQTHIAFVLLISAPLLAATPQPAEAQFWKEIKRKAKQVATDKALEQADEQFGHVIAQAVSDGRFMVALSPWTASDGSGSERYATVSGDAFFAPTGDGFSLLLCEDAGGRGWATQLALRGGHGAPAVPYDSSEYDVASNLVSMAVTDPHARTESRAEGAVSFQSVTQDLWVGTARLTLPGVSLTPEADPQPVQVAATFRARPLAQGGERPPCVLSTGSQQTTRYGATPPPARRPTQSARRATLPPAPNGRAQSSSETEPEVFMVVDEMPQPIGGMEGLQARMRYPASARQAGIEGRVLVQFTVDSYGRVREATVLRSPDSSLNAEALRLIETAVFQPGKQRGQPISVKMSLPITFALR